MRDYRARNRRQKTALSMRRVLPAKAASSTATPGASVFDGEASGDESRAAEFARAGSDISYRNMATKPLRLVLVATRNSSGESARFVTLRHEYFPWWA